MYDLNAKIESGRATIPVIKIHVHNEWNNLDGKYDADIAMLELSWAVQFTDYIQPLCLWDSQSLPSATEGIVIGYGRSEDFTKEHENTPKKIELPIHNNEFCYIKEPRLATISSLRTFCAGSGDGTGVCVGDSGGALLIKVNNVYYFRGIVSASLINDGFCDVYNYAVFTNVLKFKDWIETTANIVKKAENSDQCGVMSAATGLIQRGEVSSRREFPWLALIVAWNLHNSSAALITLRHVITHPDAVTDYDYNSEKYERISMDRIKIYLGTEGNDDYKVVADPSRIAINPNYQNVDGTDIYAIAVLKLKNSVTFSEFIRPVCMWNFDSDNLDLIKRSPIYAVGYGVDETGKTSNVKKHTKMNLVDQEKCKESHKREPNVFTSTKVFCTTSSERFATPCDYDYHLFVKYNNKWYLRGALISYDRYNDNTCRSGSPALYEDLAAYKNWIKAQVE